MRHDEGDIWIIRAGAMGDMVMMTAVCRALAERCGRPVRLVTSGPWSPPLLERCPAVRDWQLLGSMKTHRWFNPAKRRALRALRAQPAAGIWVCGGDRPSWNLARRSGLPPERLHWISHQERQADEHVLDAMLRFVGAEPGGLPQLQPSAADEADAAGWTRTRGLEAGGFLLVQPGNKKTMKRGRHDRPTNSKYWPLERWQELLCRLHADEPGLRLVLCGTAGEAALTAEIAAGLPAGAVVDAAGDLPIGRLLVLAQAARAMISVDTGPAHAAAAMGCPVLVLFGETDPRKYLPRGPAPALAVHALGDTLASGGEWWAAHHHIDMISADMAYEQWGRLCARIEGDAS